MLAISKSADRASLFFEGLGALECRVVPTPRIEELRNSLVRPIGMTTCDIEVLIIAGHAPPTEPKLNGRDT